MYLECFVVSLLMFSRSGFVCYMATEMAFFSKLFFSCIFTRSPCNSRIFWEMKIRELQNREFQGPQHLGIDVS